MNESTKKHTPGPWKWFGNPTTGFYLATAHYGRRVVMAFKRLGMREAQPVFRRDGTLVPGSELCRFAAAPEVVGISEAKKNRERVYRFDITEFDSPDARLISEAPELFDALENLIEAVGDSGHTFCASLQKWDELSKALNVARNALNKAKGEPKDADRCGPICNPGALNVCSQIDSNILNCSHCSEGGPICNPGVLTAILESQRGAPHTEEQCEK